MKTISGNLGHKTIIIVLMSQGFELLNQEQCVWPRYLVQMMMIILFVDLLNSNQKTKRMIG